MKIKSFQAWDKLILDEMAHLSGINAQDNYSGKVDWDSFYKNDKNTKLIIDKLPGGYKVYNNISNYFLTDVNDDYKGILVLLDISLSNSKILQELKASKVYQISSSNQDGTVKGFYNIIFTAIFTHTDIDVIMSDNNFSDNALKSYNRLNTNSKLNIFVYTPDNKQLQPFNDNIIANKLSSVAVVTSDKHMLKEVWNMYTTKLVTNISYLNEYYNRYTNKLDGNYGLYMMCFTCINGRNPVDEWC